MEIQFTCDNCQSSVEVFPSLNASEINCSVCHHTQEVKFSNDHLDGNLIDCPSCGRKDFYKQKDFNRKLGVALFIIAAIASIWTYGISLIVLWLLDLFLFSKIGNVAICYKCNTNFRDVKNMSKIPGFDHEMNDRIVYSDHDFEGKPLEH